MSDTNNLIAILFFMVAAPVFIASATEAWGNERKRKNAARIRALLEDDPLSKASRQRVKQRTGE